MIDPASDRKPPRGTARGDREHQRKGMQTSE